MSSSQSSNVALIFGATGITGWALCKELLTYPTPMTFTRILGVMRTPVTPSEASLPEDPRLQLIGGIDLMAGTEGVKTALSEKVPGIEAVTHVYYTAWTNALEGGIYQGNKFHVKDINAGMVTSAATAVDALCPSLTSFILQTGNNHYGVALFGHLDKIQFSLPLKESTPRVPKEHGGDEVYYYPQVDAISSVQQGKKWTWSEVRPDAIVGFTPRSSFGMSVMESIAFYLALFRYVNGPGAEVAFPGMARSWDYAFTDSSQDIVARSDIFVSLQDGLNGEAFDAADTETPMRWSSKWPKVCSWFGLKEVGPRSDEETVRDGVWAPTTWYAERSAEYEKMVKEFGLKYTKVTEDAWVISHLGFVWLARDRQVSLQKIRGLGFEDELVEEEGWHRGLERMATAKLIPSREQWSS